MKVVIVGPDASAKGGIATVIRNFKGMTTHSFVDLFFFTTWREGRVGKHLSDSLLSIMLFPIFLKRNKIDLVHLHVAQNGSFYRKSLLLIIAKLLGTSVIIHLHASQFDQFYKSRSRLIKRWISVILQEATGVVALSHSWKNYYESIANIQCDVMPNAVVVPEENPYNRQATNIVSFGRIGKRKGTFDLLKVAQKMEQRYPEIQFILYGDGDLKTVEQQIVQLGIKNVRLGGWVTDKDKEDVLRESAIHVLPSYQEGMPMAILETMAQGIPNISTNVGGIPQVINSGESGLIIEPGNLAQLEGALINLIENKNLANHISQKSYETIQNNFSINTYYKKWCDYYKKIGGNENG